MIISFLKEFESLRLRFDDYGLAIWQVLFVLARKDWGEGIGQTWASVIGKGRGGISQYSGIREGEVTTLGGQLLYEDFLFGRDIWSIDLRIVLHV